MKNKVILLLALILLAVGVYYAIRASEPEDTYIPIDTATTTPVLMTVPLDELGITFELPEGWTIGQNNLKNAWVIDSPADGFLGIVIQPEGYYYHNALATNLSDYKASYRGWELDIVIDSSESTTIDGEPALFQMFRAGDSYIDGKLDTTSLASIYNSVPRYVVQHPFTKEFIIVAGNSLNFDALQSIAENIRFIKR